MNKKDNSGMAKLKKFLLKNAFPLFGFGALLWFLIRVIPKPSRAGYPCMKVAAPMASSFVLWLLGLSATLFSFNGLKKAFVNSSPGKMMLFLCALGVSLLLTMNHGSIVSLASVNEGFDETVTPNNPIGEAKGIYPGRVVWVWDPDATNEECKNTYTGSQGMPADSSDDGWFLSKNNNQEAIDSMLSDGLMQLTGETTDLDAWESIFRFFNNNKHGLDEGYAEGQKIFIKINATSTWGKGFSWGNISGDNEHMQNEWYGIAETSPHVILALLRQLVVIYGVPEENISIGDPLKHIYQNSYDLWHSEFPSINYMAYEGGNGRIGVVETDNEVITYSDKGNSMNQAVQDKIYNVMLNADYLINVPTMKAHARAGVTLFAKNHFGSHSRNNAEHLHPGLVAPENAQPIRTDSSMYRVQVDLMGHEKFGGNQVLFLLDGLWAGSEATDPPTKWDMAPFNGDWTSSLFLSQDPVAIESVAFDFLYNEYDGSWNMYNFTQKVNYPHMNGTTDYLRQAASSEFWPEGVLYDPEDDGTPIGSLGVNEHWNNAADKQYSRNLGTGNGIELVFIDNSRQILVAPSALNAAVMNETDVELSWNDNADNEEGYVIERRENRENTEFEALDSVIADVTTYLDDSEKTYSSYEYRIFAFSSDAVSDYSQSIIADVLVSIENDFNLANEFRLDQNYPNPFNPVTVISFVLKERASVKLEIFDLKGSLINTLLAGDKESGNYSVEWNGTNNRGNIVTSGNYIYRLSISDGAQNIVKSRKMTFLK